MIDFVGRRSLFYLVSLLILIPGLVSLALPGRLKSGIEFSSGTTFAARFAQPVSEMEFRAALTELGYGNARVQRATDGRFLVRTRLIEGAVTVPPIGAAPPSEREELETALESRFGPLIDGQGVETHRFLEFSSVSPSVSADIGRHATLAVLVASLAVVGYVTFSFVSVPRPFRYGTAVLVALVHDVIVVLGAASIMGRLFGFEIDTLFITATLTVVGYSVHDSIVVLDRVRENVQRAEAAGLQPRVADAVNASLNQTLGRSLNTSITVMLVLVALILLGGETIRDFLLVMLIGLVAGTYSSIFVAAQLLVSWDEGDFTRFFRRRQLREATA